MFEANIIKFCDTNFTMPACLLNNSFNEWTIVYCLLLYTNFTMPVIFYMSVI